MTAVATDAELAAESATVARILAAVGDPQPIVDPVVPVDPYAGMQLPTRPEVAPKPWIGLADCVGLDADLFFPERGDHLTTQVARAVCLDCPARRPCAEWAIASREKHGIWGGTSERQRRAIREGHRTLDDVLAELEARP